MRIIEYRQTHPLHTDTSLLQTSFPCTWGKKALTFFYKFNPLNADIPLDTQGGTPGF